MALLDKIIQVLPQAQKLAIKSLLASKKKYGEFNTAREELLIAEKLYEDLKNKLGKQIFTSPNYAEPDTKISSALHNKNMENIFIDLNGIYNQVDALGKSESAKTTALQSDYYKSRAAIEKLINDARAFALRRKYNKFTEINVIDFNSARNMSKNFPKADIDPNTRLLELKPISSTQIQGPNRGLRVTRVYTKTISPGIKANLSADFPPEGMVDNKPETFWVTSVMSDLPIKQTYSASESVIDKVDGPIVEIYLSFSHIEHLNVVRLLPFGEYPIRLLDVAYKPNPSSEVFYPVYDFEDPPSLDWIEINFPPIYASELKLTIAQENPKQVIYHLPKELVANTDIFNYILREKSNKEFTSQFFDSDLMDSLRRSVSAYEDALKDLESLIAVASLEKNRLTEVSINDEMLATLGIVLDQVDSTNQSDNNRFIGTTINSPIVEIKKYEYILGVRELEAGYEIYSPVSYFESDMYLPQTTLSEVQIEVDERHLPLANSWGTYYPTSTEWSIDIGEGRVVPIHPVNKTGEFGYPAAQDEYLDFDRNSNTAFTRLGCSRANILSLKKNGVPMPLSGYTQERQTQGIPRIKLTLAEGFYDENSVYTADYEVVSDSYSIDVLASFAPRSLPTPETYATIGPDNDILLQRYPYVEYEVINRTGEFTQETGNAKWFYRPPIANIATGHIIIRPTVLNSLNQTLTTGTIFGTSTGANWGSRSGQVAYGLNNLSAGYYNSPFGYYIQIQDVKRSFKLSGTANNTGLIFYSPPEFTLAELQQMPEAATTGMSLLTGAAPSGFLTVEYVIGVGLSINSNVYAFNESIYQPLKVTVAGKEAKNITNYQTLQHPAFSLATTQDNSYQFIHAGRRLYFNQPINTEIKIDYDWLTQFIKVNGMLRCNKQMTPDFTPKVNELRVLMNTSIL